MAAAALALLLAAASFARVGARTWYVKVSDPKADDEGPGTESQPFRSIRPAALQAMPGDTVLVGAGVYRERVAPARSGEPGRPITYMAAPGEQVVVRGSEVVAWARQADGTHLANLQDSLFDTLDGRANGTLYNPFDDYMQPGGGCNTVTTGQVYANGRRLTEVSKVSQVVACKSAAGCFHAAPGGRRLVARWVDASVDASQVEVTVRSRVFAPHLRGLGHITVQGFVLEHGANQWCAGFWFPANARYAQSGLLGTRSGYMWTIRNNTIRFAQTIGLDIGVEGGYEGSWPPPDNEGTMQPTPEVHGNHVVEHNIFEHNGVSAIQGYMTSGTVSYNVMRNNGAVGCTGAENAVIKTHDFNGTFEGNLVYNNSLMPFWFDGGWHDMRFTRNVIVNNGLGSGGIDFEMSFGPALVDNNIIVGDKGGFGIMGMDASGVTVVHNVIAGFSHGYRGGGESLTIGHLTGRACGEQKQTCAARNWTVEANMLLAAGAPWAEVHAAKKGTHGEDLVTDDAFGHNAVTGLEPSIGAPHQGGVSFEGNVNVTGALEVSVDVDNLVLTLTPGTALFGSGCAAGGPGGDVDFSGKRRGAVRCVPGPVEDLVAGQPFAMSLQPAAPSPAEDAVLLV